MIQQSNVMGSFLSGQATRQRQELGMRLRDAAEQMNAMESMAMQSAPTQSLQYNAMATYGGPSRAAAEAMEAGERMMSDLMRDFNLSPEEAAGIVGNLDHESGGFKTLQEISPLVEGSRGGFGYAQWTGPRRRQFEQWTQENGLDPTSYEANYGFLKHELTATPEGRVIDKLRGVGSVDDAARIFSETFLRPGIPHMGSRLERAQKYASTYGQKYQPQGAGNAMSMLLGGV